MQEQLIEEFALSGRVVVITGAGSGIGQETARVFSQAGASVVLADVNETGLAATAALVDIAGRPAVTHITNVGDRAQVDELADSALRVAGRLDAWVNCAGVLSAFPILDADEDELERVLTINLKGQYWGCAAAGRVMQGLGRGSIVNISSAAADNPTAGLSAYAISKSGVNMLTRMAALEFSTFNCRVNAIAPGFIDTAMGSSAYTDSDGAIDLRRRAEFLRARAEATPLGITGRARDVALAALYLASDASRFVTGQVLRTNGGLVML